jgi:hypothetical protein
VPIKYSGEEQTICAVGLLKPRPGVFLAGVQHVLLVCTASGIVMLGVCTSGRQHEELSLQPLPLYTLPTDGVIMCCCTATASGRIFLGGADGHVYEVQYHTTDKWLQRRVAKVRAAAVAWLGPTCVAAVLCCLYCGLWPAVLPGTVACGLLCCLVLWHVACCVAWYCGMWPAVLCATPC